MDEELYDSKNFYFKKDNQIIGIHAIGIAGPYEYNYQDLDGNVYTVTKDFQVIESWGNEYNPDYTIKGRGSFRVFYDLDEAVKSLEDDGWVQFKREEP